MVSVEPLTISTYYKSEPDYGDCDICIALNPCPTNLSSCCSDYEFTLPGVFTESGQTYYIELSASSTSTGIGFTGCCVVVNTIFKFPRTTLENYNIEDLNFSTIDGYGENACVSCSGFHPEIPCPPLVSLTPTQTPTLTPTKTPTVTPTQTPSQTKTMTPTKSIACCPPTILSFSSNTAPTYTVYYNATGSCGTCGQVTIQIDDNPFFTSPSTRKVVVL
jgi:hypothetical protein